MKLELQERQLDFKHSEHVRDRTHPSSALRLTQPQPRCLRGRDACAPDSPALQACRHTPRLPFQLKLIN